MIRVLLGSALLALTAAEADPQLLYGAALPYAAAPVLAPVGAVAHAPVVKSVVDTPAEVSHEVTAHTVPVAVGYHGLGHFGYYGKRSADAEPAVIAGSSRIVSAPTPLIHNPPALPVAYAHPLAYAGYAAHPLAYHGLPLVAPVAAAEPAVAAERKKREADPQVLLNGAVLPYAAPLAAPATFATVGAVAHHPVVKSVVDTPAEVEHEVTAHHVPLAVGYHGLGHFGYYGKRSADAEPAVIAGSSRIISAPTPLIHNPPALPAVTYAAHPLAYAGYAAHPLAYHGLPVVAPAAVAEA